MRMIWSFTVALAMTALAWAQAPTAPAKKATTAPAAVHKMPAKTTSTTQASAAKRPVKKVPVVRTTWRTRQTAPTSDRYREIQTALAAHGYLSADDANGAWGPSSTEALKKFQADQTLETTGKIDSLSLIALGLGPKHDSVPVVADGNVQPDSGRN